MILKRFIAIPAAAFILIAGTLTQNLLQDVRKVTTIEGVKSIGSYCFGILRNIQARLLPSGRRWYSDDHVKTISC
jgi:hypothetical protein